jgi:hypothetical protein
MLDVISDIQMFSQVVMIVLRCIHCGTSRIQERSHSFTDVADRLSDGVFSHVQSVVSKFDCCSNI